MGTLEGETHSEPVCWRFAIPDEEHAALKAAETFSDLHMSNGTVSHAALR